MTPPLRTRISGERFHERGATFIEFALILPLLVLIIFFLLEIGRYMALYSTLNIGADQAVGLASKIEGLDGTPGTADYDAAFNTVLAKAQEPGLAGFLTPNLGQGSATLRSINLSVPVPTGGESVAQAMMDEPIRLTMEAELRPVIPLFPTWPIRIIAESFREQRKIASLPVPT
ncbi:MAG: pilus assembly protein, partial [Deltaproteobacteria bacterium]|nr:pilus assembly protein [Deltaproteobacteria bacterium]